MQFSALLAKLKDDAGFREKLLGAAGLDAAVAMAQEAGFDVSKTDWFGYQAKLALELTDLELDRVAGGKTDGPNDGDRKNRSQDRFLVFSWLEQQ